MKKFVFSVAILFLFYSCNAAIINKKESLLQLIKFDNPDTNKINHLIDLSFELKDSNPDTSLLLCSQALETLKNIENLQDFFKQFFKCRILNSFGTIYFLKSNYTKSLDYYLKALAINDKLEQSAKKIYTVKLLIQKSTTLSNIGVLYDDQGDYQKALVYYFKALKLVEPYGDNAEIAYKLGNIGVAYKNIAFNTPNNIQYRLKKDTFYIKALDYYFRALKLEEKLGNKDNMATWNGDIGEVYFELGDYNKALDYYFKALKLDKEIDNKNVYGTWLFCIGALYTEQGKYSEAYNYLYNSLSVSNSLGSMIDLKSEYEELSKLYEKSKICLPDTIGCRLLNKEEMRLRALYYYKKSIEVRDTLFSQDSRKQLIQKEMTFEFEKKEALTQAEHDKQIAIADAENKRQKVIIFFVTFGLLSILLFAIFILRTLNITRKQKKIIEEQKLQVDEANEELNQQNDEIAAQRDEIESQRDLLFLQKKEITDSIEYAKYIQQALLASHEIINNCVADYFVLFKPRDIISGDFYWFKQIKNYFYFTAADCTGHGVPGAFMSVLGISLLNEIISKRDLNPPGMVLNDLRKRLKKSLNQSNPETAAHDGMDIALCLLDIETKKLQFSGAFNPLILIRNNELIEFAADHMPVGVHPKDVIDFTNQEIQLQPNDLLYIFSDGYVSQFGGEFGKKFNITRFKQLLFEINNQTLDIQKKILDQKLFEWQNDNRQIDDILVIGIRI